MWDFILCLCGCCFGKNNWDSSIPKSVNSPVKCVVLTTVFEIFVTYEFCKPIAKSSKQAIRSGYSKSTTLLIITTESKITHSIKVGITNTLSFLFSRYSSIKKLETKDPKRNEKKYKK